MLPQFLGMLLLTGAAGFVAVALGVALWARSRTQALLARRALIAGSGIVGVYGLFWLLGVGLARRVVLPPGQEISFCGLDCHLHVSVQRVRWGPDLGVTVHFASNAKQAPERPAALRFRLRDGTGQERVTWGAQFDSFPMFSPDGKKLAWASNRNGKDHETNIFVADWAN